jgi:hypothetical protein
MQDPLQQPLAKLASMYDSGDHSDDEILDLAVDLIRTAHSLLGSFISGNRFVEAYRQLLHCEEILQEAYTERKVISILPEGSADRKAIDQLRTRTLLLQGQFERARTAGKPATTSGTHSDLVGPPPAPRHGGGGLVRAPPPRLLAPTKPPQNKPARVSRQSSIAGGGGANQKDEDDECRKHILSPTGAQGCPSAKRDTNHDCRHEE